MKIIRILPVQDSPVLDNTKCRNVLLLVYLIHPAVFLQDNRVKDINPNYRTFPYMMETGSTLVLPDRILVLKDSRILAIEDSRTADRNTDLRKILSHLTSSRTLILLGMESGLRLSNLGRFLPLAKWLT